MRRWAEGIWHWLARKGQRAAHSPVRTRGPLTHVILLDGTLCSLDPDSLPHVGRIYHLLRDSPAAARLSLYYEAGLQWQDWRSHHHVILGRGINRQIRRAYGYLASRYHPGDRIFLVGYSRGAYAVRSLAGVIDRVGLLRPEHALTRNIRQAYRHYETGARSLAAQRFSTAHCHEDLRIEAIGVFDTVKALGLRLPLLWRLTEASHAFHTHDLGAVTRHGYHALALDETRQVFAPVLWSCPTGVEGDVQQVWFRGAHGDVGGQLGSRAEAAPLSHIPLTWMLERLEQRGLPLPEAWRARFPCDPGAPMVGTWTGWGKTFPLRARRKVGQDASEAIHPSAGPRATAAQGFSIRRA